MGLLKALVLFFLLIGYIRSDSEKDFEFAGEKDSFSDDEDLLVDEAGSGEGSGDIGEVSVVQPTGVPALYRAVINVTSVAYTDEIAAAGRDISSLAITQQLQDAIQKLLNTLRGSIRIRIVDLQPGSLMVTFDIDTDGQQTEQEIVALLQNVLNQGNLNGFRVSEEGFEFRRIRDIFTCSTAVGREPSSLPEQGNLWANLMINNQFPCNGFVVGWRYYRSAYFGTTIIGVFRQISDTEFILVAKTILPSENAIGIYTTEPDSPILVRKGDFIGIFHPQDSRGSVIPFARAGSDPQVPESELYQNYYTNLYESDLEQNVPFKITDFVYSENLATYALEAVMSYENVPDIEIQPLPSTCAPDQWQCNNGECVNGEYRCDNQPDCYDGSDEENCPAPACPSGEFQCADGQQCLPPEFVCNFVNDCADASDELNCGPAPVRILSFRQGTQPSSFEVSWMRPQPGGSVILSYRLKYRKVLVRSETTLDGDYIVQSPLELFRDVLISDPSQDKYILSDLDPGSYYEVEIRALNRIGESEPRSFVFRTASAGCIPGEWQCRDGGCIPLQARCDAFPGDCADDSDEEGCDDEIVCLEGQILCRLSDGSEECRDDAVGCAVVCTQDQFQCLDGLKCISFGMLCDGRVDCDDSSDESNCECVEGEFQCSAGRQCIDERRRCDGVQDCDDSSDEENCPCPSGTFQCLNTSVRVQCVTEALVCDGVRDCDDGSDEVNCPTTPRPGCAEGLWQCDDGSCIPDRMRCDGVPQCEDSSDELRCPGCRADQFTCADGNCVEGRMRCDGVPQCEDLSDEDGCGCRSDQFTCNDGNCVEGRMRCDGVPQCEDSSDELNCPCRDGMFQCRDGNCVEGNMKCDGTPQCEDGSDEEDCPPINCPASDFQCTGTALGNVIECIDRRLRCDGYADCTDGSDEENCPGCRRDQFTCESDGQCLPDSARCNGIIECEDRSDELNCVCRDDQFRCGDGICIDLARRCDRQVDCSDRSDELACPCRSGEFQCVNGQCIPESRRCDNRIDCRDRSDEDNCPRARTCPEGYYTCGTGHCLSLPRRCDGRSDCPDGSDEQNCPLRCAADEMECVADNKCLTADQICNRVYDCSDRRDELNCDRCTENEFQCESDRSCISAAGRCNGRKECSDGSDEMNCPTLPPISVTVSPKNLRIRAGAEALIICIAQGLPQGARIEWVRRGDALPMQSAVEMGKLMIPVAKPMDSGEYICRVVGAPGSFEDNARLEVVPIGPTAAPEPGKCGRDEAVCQNGQCIRREYRCDGEPDCADGSDEPDDCFGNLCEPNEFQCPSGQCVMKIWRCDGENDCDDGFDESNCAAKDPDEPCGFDEFQCMSGDQCIPLAYQCDQEIDCLDRSDEIGCSPPIITLPPVAEIEVELGSTFTIICEAVGVPVPLIVWRLNWGNIPTGDRVTVTSSDGRGILTIADARYEDAGAYTCEAINNRGSIFAIPDALVIVRLDANITVTNNEVPVHAERIITIGGASDVLLDPEKQIILINYPGNCPDDLDVTFDGSKLSTNCRFGKQKVDIAYIGKKSVNLEIAKKVAVFSRRGDIVPEVLNDSAVVYIGGLSSDIKESLKDIQLIKNVLIPSFEEKVIDLQGEDRRQFVAEQQIFYVGIDKGCNGKLRLIDSVFGKELQCLSNATENGLKSKIKAHGQLEKELYRESELNEKTVTSMDKRLLTENQTNVIKKNIFEPKLTMKTENITDRTVINTEPLIEQHADQVVQVSIQERTSKDGVSRTLSPIPNQENRILNEIVGAIFEISNTNLIAVNNDDKYVELGLGSPCLTPLDVSIVDSKIVFTCEGANSIIQYVGAGAADFEFFREIVILSDSKDWSKYQREDFVVIYLGNLPYHITRKAEEIVSVKGITPKLNSGSDVSQNITVFRNTELYRHHRNQRQIIVIAVNKRCQHDLYLLRSQDKHTVSCGNKGSIPFEHLNFGDSDFLKVHFSDIEEPFLIIHGSRSVEFQDPDAVNAYFNFACYNDRYIVSANGNRFTLTCDGNKHIISFVYIGKNPSSVYISKLVLQEEVVTDDKPMKNYLSFYFGSNTGNIFEKKRMVDFRSNVHASQKTDFIDTIQMIKQSVANSSNMSSVIEIGISTQCPGKYGLRNIKDMNVIYCKQNIGHTGATVTSHFVNGDGLRLQDTGIDELKSGKLTNINVDDDVSKVYNNEDVSTSELPGRRSDILNEEKIISDSPNNSVIIEGITQAISRTGDINIDIIDVFKPNVGVPLGQPNLDKKLASIKPSIELTRPMVINENHEDNSKDKGTSPMNEDNQDEMHNNIIFNEGKTAHSVSTEVIITGNAKDSTSKDKFRNSVQNGTTKNSVSDSFKDKSEELNATLTVEKINTYHTGVTQTVTDITYPEKGSRNNRHDSINVEATAIKNIHKYNFNNMTVNRETDVETKVGSKANILKILSEGKRNVITNKTNRTIKNQTHVQNNVETLIISGKSPAESRFDDVKVDVSLVESTDTMTAMDTLPPGFVQHKNDFYDTELSKFILINRSNEHVHINQTVNSVNVELDQRCKHNYTVSRLDNDISVLCSGSTVTLQVNLYGVQEEVFEVSAVTEEVTEPRGRDIVQIYLAGIRSVLGDTGNILSLGKNSSIILHTPEKKSSLTVPTMNKRIDKNVAHFVQIGIKQDCMAGSVRKYTDTDGTVVYCARRSDILPEEEYSESDINTVTNVLGQAELVNGSTSCSLHNEEAVKNGNIAGPTSQRFETLVSVTDKNEQVDNNTSVGMIEKNSSNLSEEFETHESAPKTNKSVILFASKLELLNSHNEVNMTENTLQNENTTASTTTQPPRRGDIDISEYQNDVTYGANVGQQPSNIARGQLDNTLNHSSKKNIFTVQREERNHTYLNDPSDNILKDFNVLDMKLNKNIDLKIGQNCTGSVEAIEVNDGIKLICKFGSETLHLHLTGLSNDKHKIQSGYMNESPYQRDSNGTFIVSDKTRHIQDKRHRHKLLTLREVYIASKKKYVDNYKRRNDSSDRDNTSKTSVTGDNRSNIQTQGNSRFSNMKPPFLSGPKQHGQKYRLTLRQRRSPRNGGNNLLVNTYNMGRNLKQPYTQNRKIDGTRQMYRQKMSHKPILGMSGSRKMYDHVLVSAGYKDETAGKYDIRHGSLKSVNVRQNFENANTKGKEERLMKMKKDSRKIWKKHHKNAISHNGVLKMPRVKSKILFSLTNNRKSRELSVNERDLQNAIYSQHDDESHRENTQHNLAVAMTNVRILAPNKNTRHIGRVVQQSQVKNGNLLPPQHKQQNTGANQKHRFGILQGHQMRTGKLLSLSNKQHNIGTSQRHRDGIIQNHLMETKNLLSVSPKQQNIGSTQRHKDRIIQSLPTEHRKVLLRHDRRTLGPIHGGDATHMQVTDKYVDFNEQIETNVLMGTAEEHQEQDTRTDSRFHVHYGYGTVLGQKGPCDPPFFNLGANSVDECVRCFCFGQSVQCFSSDLQVSNIGLVNSVSLLRRDRNEEIQENVVSFKANTREYQVLDFSRILTPGSYYWSLPNEFLGERLTSYGGELKYTIYYDTDTRRPSPTNYADVILIGNGITLYYRARTQPSAGIPTSISVPLVEAAWERFDGTIRGDTPIAQFSSREEFMTVLQNVQQILVKANYDNRQSTVRIGGVFMTTAVDFTTDLGQAYLVEDCQCPTGYTGLSCQTCAPGFTRVQSGGYLGQCIPCNCNNHSNDCDAVTGECLSCQHNTYGDRCQLCVDGYYGDARRGTPNDCRPCPCPLTDPPNQFSRTCFLDSDGEVTCGNCPEGYEGRRCEKCAEGYRGDPLTPGSSCIKVPVEDICDSRGSLSLNPDPVTRLCRCKDNAMGPRCDRCQENTFYLNNNYDLGCIRCFCMGVSKSCQSTYWNRAQTGISFTRDEAGVQIADAQGRPMDGQRLQVDANNREVIYRMPQTSELMYWSLPSRFLGDKVTAYGGSLRFTLRYSSRQGQAVDSNEPLVMLAGNEITLINRQTQTIQANRPQSFNIVMYEQNWYRADGQPATREHLLMALADLDMILIRASFEEQQGDIGLRDVTLDVAEDRRTRQDRAYAVEQCVCPVGYRGLSCEDCDTGYTRSGGGLYLGLCEPCNCNGHSNECDPETGICRNCQHNTAGDYCDRCAVGYYGNATRGTRNDCQKCPCPLTEAPNQFSPTCELAEDGQVTCTACPAGHTGRQCETCIEGYTGNPLKPGDFCRLGPITRCDCDTRGTVPNTQCDEETQQCQCKPYTQGRRCARCREGYFYLEANNPQGCLPCFCSGITNQCTSSSYYRDALRPVFSNDGSHNFVLMNRRMNNIISDGFVVDASRNQITFNQFEGIQRERESLFFQLPAKFRGDRVTSYGGYLRFTLEFTARPEGRMSRDVDLEIISAGQALRLYNLFNPPIQEGRTQTYEILLRESSFNDLRSNTPPTRATFMTILSNVEGILIRATYHTAMESVTLRDVSMDTAIPTPTDLGGAPMVEDCRCPEGYTGLSCERCAQGYLRVSDGRGGIGRCVRCNCNGHASSCDPDSGRCLDCQHNTEGDRCEICKPGFYGDATSGTPNDCRECPCPLTTPRNRFSPTCFLDEDNKVTCDKCPTGYTGRQCEKCAEGYTGDPTQPGDSCRPSDEVERPKVNVSPVRVEEPRGSTAVFQCVVGGPGPFRVVWSRLDSRQLPDRASVSPRYSLTIRDLRPEDSGRYACTASNAYGVTRGTVTLQVNVGPSPIQVRIDNPRVEVEEGRTVRIVCTAVSTSREFTYILSWSKQDSQMPAKALDQNGVLIIPNVQKSDAGNYICMGSDMFTMDEEVAVLIVTDSAEQAPSVRIEPRYQTVDEGTTARFTCIVTGTPTPTIEWYRGSGEINPEATITSDGVFTIPRVSPSDESDYYCKATNDAGTTEVRTILYVKRAPRPADITVIVRRTTYTVIAGQTIRLECYSDDTTGRITLFWSRANGLPPGSTQDNGILTLTDVQKSFEGNYICTATDTDTGRVNTATTTLTVNVETPTVPPSVTVEPEKLTVAMGTTGTLRCIVNGSPTPTVTWIKSRGELSPNHQVVGNTLRITQATMEDRGIYVCRAENSAGMNQDWSIVEVERRMRPKIDIYPNVTQTIVVGGSALFQCRVMDGDPPPTIRWSRVGGLALTDKTEVMDNGVIMFKEATQTEQGSYICTATNDMGTITATVTLIVQGPPTITLQPSQTVYALIGERVTLECTAQGEPTPQVYWVEPETVRRGDLPPDVEPYYPTSDGSAILDIASVSRGDQGNYRCVASNTGGTAEETVQLIVREDNRGSAGVRISGPSTLSVVEGQSVELVCTAEAIPGASIRWARRQGALPPGHTVRGGILTIPQFREEYAGEYICSTVVPAGRFEASVFIIVTVAPRLTISPQRVTARAGETIILRCAASGSGPFDIEWMKVDGQMNPRATERGGILEIRQATAADAGRYRCVVRSTTAGINEGFAIVDIEVPPTVVVPERSVRVTSGNTAELRCSVTGTPTPTVRWEKEIGDLPAQHRIQNGILTIFNAQPEDSGRYICTATSSAGVSRDFGVITVDDGGVINSGVIQRDTQIVNVGDRVSMECIVTGTPLPRITWSRDDAALPEDAVVGEGILIIPEAKVEDAGTYTCLAVNVAGSVTSKVTLYVRVNASNIDESQPYVNAPSSTTAALGDSVSLVCEASGYPSPDITWTRKDGEMPDDYTIVDGDLMITRVRPEDAGTYTCHAQNQYGKTEVPVDLFVGDMVPYFSQDPNSYMSFKPLNDVYLDFDILLSLKPESSEGMVLYNGQFEDGGGDFVCFGLSEGYPEFRFDVGSGPAIIRGTDTLNLNQWHTIKLKRNRKQGEMVVNNKDRYTGESPGYFTGLDLTKNMYLGSVPDYNNIPQAAGFKEGFVGSISEVKIKGIDLNLGAEYIDIVGIEPYNTCRESACLNGGICMPANTKFGFQCICKQGFTGDRCQEIGMSCHQGACGQDGRCFDLEDGSGFRCICPLGKTGPGCNIDVSVINPFFNRTSFISYPPAENALFSLTIYLEFKPYSLSDGIILYEGNSRDGTGDYMALIQKDGYLEFRFDTGSGPAIVRSRYPLRLNEWTRVTATRTNREGSLIVNNEPAVTGVSPGSTVGLNLKLPLYLGGPDPTYPAASSIGVSQGFVGCVAELQVNDNKIDLLNDAIESLNIVDCGERRLCDRQPCENGATCEDLPGPDYRCICPASHTGKNCEIEINLCLTNSPCQNGAPCSITDDGYRCDCLLGYAGDNCEFEVEITTDMSFAGDGYIEFNKDLLPHANSQERQTVSFVIRTTEPEGLIFWHGEPGGRALRGGDYFAIGLKGGFVEFRYDMGSGPAVVMSTRRLNDGLPHKIAVERLGRNGSLSIDDGELIKGVSPGFLQMLNADGNIFVGGVSMIGAMTEQKYSENYKGCISDIVIHKDGPLTPKNAERGYNVEPCRG